MAELISIILPTYNEASALPGAIRSVRCDSSTEVIVVDGGSRDETLSVARSCADRVLEAPLGRASQLNAGARVASGSVLLFLHADTILAEGALAEVRRVMQNPRLAGGAFTLRIGEAKGAMRVISWCSNLRSRFLGLTYGDQAVFVRSPVFRNLGGFKMLPIMEDVDFVRRLQRVGRMRLIDIPVRTSDRRWRANGVLRTTFANLSAMVLFMVGVSTDRIRKTYDALLTNRWASSVIP